MATRGETAVGVDTPSKLFHDKVVLDARTPMPSLNLAGALDALGGGGGSSSPGGVGGNGVRNEVISLRHVRTVSEGCSPIRRPGVPVVRNVMQSSMHNRQQQVLDDLMLLSSEGVTLSSPVMNDTSRGGGQGSARSNASSAASAASARGLPPPASRGSAFTASSLIAKDVLDYCMFDDVAYTTEDGVPHAFGLNNNTLEKIDSDPHPNKGDPAYMFWVRRDQGALGVVDLRRKTRRVLLRGLAQPTRVRVVGNRIYWLETGSDWQFNGRVSFLDRTTERVHVLLSGLSLPRALHVTPSHDVFFLEVERTQEPRRRQGPPSGSQSGVQTGSRDNVSGAEADASVGIGANAGDDDFENRRRSVGKPEGTWRLSWRLRGLSGSLVDLAVAGANFGLQRRKRTFANMGGPEDIWWDLDDHVQDLDRVSLFSINPPPPTPRGSPGDVSIRYIGMATPTDITVLGGGGGSTVLVISVKRYSIPEFPPAVKNLQIAGQRYSNPSKTSKDDGDETDVDQLRAAMFNDTLPRPAGARVDGGALMWLTMDDEDEANSEADSERVPYTMCVLQNPADRIELSPAGVALAPLSIMELEDELVMATLLLSNTVGMVLPAGSAIPRDAAMQQECMNSHGWGLAALSIPSSCCMGLRDAQKLLSPLISNKVRCFDIVGPRSVSKVVSTDQILFNVGESRQGSAVRLLCDQEAVNEPRKCHYPWRDLILKRTAWSQLTVPRSEEYMDDPVGVGDDEFSEFLVTKHGSLQEGSGRNKDDDDDDDDDGSLASDEEWVTDSEGEEAARKDDEGVEAEDVARQKEAMEKSLEVGESDSSAAIEIKPELLENEAPSKLQQKKKKKRKRRKKLMAPETKQVEGQEDGNKADIKREDQEQERVSEDEETPKKLSEEETTNLAKAEEAAARAAAFRGMASSSSMRSLFAGPQNGDIEDGEDGPSMQIKVVLRCRPLFDDEKDAGAHDVVKCTTNDVVVLPSPTSHDEEDYLGHNKGRQRFGFERVYGRATTQQELFEESVRPSILSAVEGYNVTVFAYGQTGTGKTYTMEGDMESTELAGIIPRSIYAIYDLLQSTCMPGDYEITVSHLEIYQEELNDLLSPHNEAESLTARLSKRKFTTSLALAEAAKKRGVNLVYDPSANARMSVDALRNGRLIGPLGDVLRSRIMAARLKEVDRDHATQLRIVDDHERGVIVKNLTERAVKSPEQIFEVLEHSIAKRVTAETMCNGQSSRSHAVFTINVHVKERDAGGSLTGTTRIGRLNLVDLSGSENRKRAGGPGVGVRASESKAINQGLLSLGRVIKARTEGGAHIPFRDSKLTRILEESLGGNCITTLILTISPNHKEAAETLSTLNYAHKAKVIENRPRRFVQKEEIKKGSGEDSGEGSDSEYSGDEDGVSGRGKRRGKRKNRRGAERRRHGGASWREGRVVMPWVGRVPVRRTPGGSLNGDPQDGPDRANSMPGRLKDVQRGQTGRSSIPRSEPALGEARMLHAPSLDWVQNMLLGSTRSDDPFKIDPAVDDAKEFGYSSARIMERSANAGSGKKSLSGQAVAALHEIFSRFTREDLKALQGYINSPPGAVLNRALFSAEDNRGGNSAGASVSGRSFGSASGAASNRPTNRTQGTNKTSSFPERIRRIGAVTPQLFLQIFAAAARIDPIRATFVVSKLGYRPNFSSLNAPGYDVAGEDIMASTLTEMKRTLGSTGRSSVAAGRRATAPKGKSKGKSRSRPASAGASRRKVGSARTNSKPKGKRPSTAGARRSSKGVAPPTSFVRGDITARHRRGPIHFFWRWLGRAPPPPAPKAKRRGSRGRKG